MAKHKRIKALKLCTGMVFSTCLAIRLTPNHTAGMTTYELEDLTEFIIKKFIESNSLVYRLWAKLNNDIIEETQNQLHKTHLDETNSEYYILKLLTAAAIKTSKCDEYREYTKILNEVSNKVYDE